MAKDDERKHRTSRFAGDEPSQTVVVDSPIASPEPQAIGEIPPLDEPTQPSTLLTDAKPVDTRPQVAVRIDATIAPATLLTLALAVHDAVDVAFIASNDAPTHWHEAVAYRCQHAGHLRIVSPQSKGDSLGSVFETELPSCVTIDAPRDSKEIIDVATLTSLLSDPVAVAKLK